MMQRNPSGTGTGRTTRPSIVRSPRAVQAAAGRLFEPLESREMLTVNVLNAIGDRNIGVGGSALIVDLLNRYDNPALTGSIYRFNSVLGSFNIEMFDQAGEARTRTTPLTVANFANYVNAGRYLNNMIHRSIPNFVLQGGGFTARPVPDLFGNVTTFAQLQNEAGNTNIRGTIAMAKIGAEQPGGGPNSATSQWFVNLGNNSANLDFQNGGFTAFGRVIGSGMNVVDALAAIPTFDFDEPFSDVPLRNYSQQDFENNVAVRTENLATFSSIDLTTELTYTVTSSNTELLNATIVNGRLVLNPAATGSGVVNVTFRIDSADGSFVEDNFAVTVGAPAGVGNLAPSAVRLASISEPLTLTATGTEYQNPSLTAVSFFRDSNGNGAFDSGTDTLLGVDTDGNNGWSINVNLADTNLGFASGGNLIFARGTAGATTDTTAAAISLNTAPQVLLVARSARVVPTPGNNLTITAMNTRDADGTVASVQFYRDANGNGTLEPETDILLGTDSTPNDGFSFTGPTTGFPIGSDVAILTRAVDNEGAFSAVVSTTIRVNALPVIGTFTGSGPTLARGQSFVLSASNVTDTDSGTAGNRIDRIDFFRDTNGNGVFDQQTDQILANVPTQVGGVYTFTLTAQATLGLPAGNLIFFAVPLDRDLGFGAAMQITVAVTNTNPTLTSMTATPGVVPNLGGNVTLTAIGAADPDGVLARVEFYRESGGNPDAFDPGIDTLLGEDNTPLNGFSLTVNTGNVSFGFSPGINKYYARVFDTDGGSSGAVTITNRINAAPSVAGVFVSPNPIARNSSYTLTAIEPDDEGTVARVEFYRDTNGNGQLDVGVDVLLGSDANAAGGYTFTGVATNFPANVTLFARVIDNDNGASAAVSTSAAVENARPTVSTLTVTPNPLTVLGASFNLVATGFADNDGLVQQMRFYRDDGDGIFEADQDTLLGTDASSAGGFTLTVNTAGGAFGIAFGPNTFFAQAVDNDGAGSVVAATATVRVNAPPTVGGLSGPTSVGRLQQFTLTATDVVDTTEPGFAGTITAVRFYRDTNANGVLDILTDQLLGTGTRQTGTNTWTFTGSTAGFAFGNNTFFARAQDNNSGFSDITGNATTAVNVTNTNPTVASITPAPAIVSNLGGTFTITATGAADLDGTVQQMRFYRDANDNNTYDEGVDTLIATDTSAVGGFSATINTGEGGFVTGLNRIFAVAVDNDGGLSSGVTATTVRVNAAPITGNFSVSSPVARGGMITLTVTGVVDVAEAATPAGTITTVQFFRDSNGNGTFDASTDQLLGVGVRQTGTNTYVLTRTTAGFATGTNTYFVRATDNNGGLSAVAGSATTTGTITNALPTLTSATVTPPVVSNLGGTFTITGNGAADSDGVVTALQMAFFRDANGDGIFNILDDTLIGTDLSSAGGFSATVNTGDGTLGFTTGSNTLFAVATDADGGSSTARAVNIRINAGPTVGGFTVSSPVARGGMITLTATGVVDVADSAAAGTITTVQFFRDSNSNGTFDATTDQLLGVGVRQTGTNTYTLTRATTGFSTGTNTYFVRATDNNQGLSAVGVNSTTTGTITNAVPLITGVTVTPALVTSLGGNVTLTATNPRDTDGTLAGVQFFRDDGDGLFDPLVDTLLGTDSSAVGGYSLVIASTTVNGFAVGTNRYFARAVDNDGAFSTAAVVSNRINAAPVVGTLTTNGPVARRTSITLTASNVTDTGEVAGGGQAGTITRVDFFLDSNNNGVFDPTTDRLLGSDATATGGQYSFVASTVGFPITPRFFARAVDNNAGMGTTVDEVATVTATLTNIVPTIAAVSGTPAPIANLGNPLTVTATGVLDTDGTIASVSFYRDTNGNNAFDVGDTLVGIDNNAAGGFSAIINTGDVALGFVHGVNRIIAVATDNDGGTSVGTLTNIRINRGPDFNETTASATTSIRGTAITFTAVNVLDRGDSVPAGTITAVQFFLDANANGLIDTGERLLGSGIRVTGTNDFRLVTTTTGFATGQNTVLARATDNNGGFSTNRGVIVNVTNRAPTLTVMSALPAIVPGLGSTLNLTATGAADPDGTIASVRFYRDANGDGLFNILDDTLLGTDNSATGGFTLAVNTGDGAFGFTTGANRVFAVAVDNNGGTSTGTATAQVRVNAVPTIGGVTTNLNTVARGGSVIVTATNVVDQADSIAAGTITTVQFFHDTDGNGFLTTADRLLGAGVRLTGTNDFRLTASTTGFNTGLNNILVRATDNNGGQSAASAATITVTNAAPLVTSASVAPVTVAFLGQNVTITAIGARDTDGTVQSVQFFLEASGDSTLGGGDTFLGIDTNAAGGYTFAAATLAAAGFGVGTNRVYAVVNDNEGASVTVAVNFTISATNVPPVVGTLANNGPIIRNNNVTLTASNLSDTDGTVTAVEFYRDVNGNGNLEIGIDQLLGTASVLNGTATLSTSTRTFATGDNGIFARARDSRMGFGLPVSTNVIVTNRAPTITSLTAAPATVAALGNNLTLTAVAPADADGTISFVDFWYDLDNNGFLDVNIDILLGTDNSAVGGYSIVVNTGTPQFMITEGTRRFFARVADNDLDSAIAQATARINAAPLIPNFDVTTGQSISRTGTFTLEIEASDDLNVTSISIFRDASPFDNTLTAADVLVGTAVRVGTSNIWTFTRSGSVLPAGTYQLFARAVDASGVFSAVASVVVVVA